MIEKTLSTFLSASVVLAKQYGNMRFEIHSDLMALIIFGEKQNEILLQNTEAHLIGTTVSESHAVKVSNVKPKAHNFKKHR